MPGLNSLLTDGVVPTMLPVASAACEVPAHISPAAAGTPAASMDPEEATSAKTGPAEKLQEEDVSLNSLQIWCYSASGALHPVSACNELQLLTEDRMKGAAAEAIRAQGTIAGHVAGPKSLWIVAQPIVDEPHTCLIAAYSASPNISPVQSIARTLLALQALGRGLIASRHPEGCNGAMTLAEQSVNAVGGASLTWRFIAGNALAKLKEHIRWGWSKRGAVAAVALGTVLIALIPVPYRVYCGVACEPSVRRYVAAPFDATLVKTLVSVGQHVSAGELLATLDGSELRSTLAGLQAEYAQQIQLKLASLRTREHSEAELARLKSEQLENEIKVIEQKLASLEIRSPIDGIIVNGDLEGAEGAPLTIGQTLFEIGHLDSMVAELQIPEEKIADVQLGQVVTITLDSFGGRPFRSSVDSIHPRSELIAEASVFVAEAQMPSVSLELKPGMHGQATIAAGYRSLGWLYLHRPFYRVRQYLGW